MDGDKDIKDGRATAKHYVCPQRAVHFHWFTTCSLIGFSFIAVTLCVCDLGGGELFFTNSINKI